MVFECNLTMLNIHCAVISFIVSLFQDNKEDEGYPTSRTSNCLVIVPFTIDNLNKGTWSNLISAWGGTMASIRQCQVMNGDQRTLIASGTANHGHVVCAFAL